MVTGDEVVVLVDGLDDDLGSLWNWLQGEQDLAGHLKIRQSVTEGTMGADLIIAAAVPAVAVLARSLSNYLRERERQRRPYLSIRLVRSSGASVELVANGTDPESLLRFMMDQQALDPPDGNGQ